MSNTMRTDEVNKYLRTRDEYAKTDHEIWVNHARQLERELSEWKRWCKEKEQALDDLAKVFSQQQDRIKRLEEALDTLTCVIGLTPIKGNLAALQEAFDMARTVLKAKEAKL